MSRNEAERVSRIEVTHQGAAYVVIRVKAGYLVVGQAPHGTYLVKAGVCPCKGYQHRNKCRHQEIIRVAEHLVLVERTRFRPALQVVQGRLAVA